MATAENIAKALGGRKAGGGWTARCPAHDDRTPSLSICDADGGKVLVRCHAGCGQDRVIAALQARYLWTESGLLLFSRPAPRVVVESGIAGAQSVPKSHLPFGGQRCPRRERWSRPISPRADYISHHRQDLRFQAGLKHPSGGLWPAMVALVTLGLDDTPLAIHRTFLARDGAGKAPVDPQRMMLGPCRGGVVRLAAPREVLMVGEGIETCLAAMMATGHPAWAALSTSGLRALDLSAASRPAPPLRALA